MSSRITPYAPGAARVMITDGGPHPADFWAQVTAEHIAPVADSVTGHRRAAALALQAKIAQALEPHHTKVQELERSNLKANPDHHKLEPDPQPHLDDAIATISQAAKGTEWEKHFDFSLGAPAWLKQYEDDIAQKGEDHVPLTAEQRAHLTQHRRHQVMRQEIATHFATVQHIEKSWHADRLAGRA